MPLGMKNNIASINAINHLEKAQKEMSDSLTRLASGQRINSGTDSPEGLIMSEGLRAQIASVKQALQNTEFSMSMVQTAEGALVEVNNLLIEMRQLATNAANEGANDHNTMLELQYQIRSAIEGIDRVSQFTSFGNKNLLDGTYGTKGVEGNENLLFIKGTTDTVSSPPFSGYDVNITELPKKAVLVENLDDVNSSGLNITLEEEDGAIIKVEYPENGTAEGLVNRLKKAAFEEKMNLDINFNPEEEELTIEHREYGLAKGFSVTVNKEGVILENAFEPKLFLGGDVNGTINGEATDGDAFILTGEKDNENTSGLSVAFLGDKIGNAGSVTIVQDALKFQIGTSANDKILMALNSTHSKLLGRGVFNISGFENLSQIRLTTAQEAKDSIRLVDEALDQLISMRSQLGSVQKNTLETNISVLRSSAENLTAAESSIRDTDMALEIVNYTKNQIIAETAAAAVAQANQNAARVLRLLFSNAEHKHLSFFAEH